MPNLESQPDLTPSELALSRYLLVGLVLSREGQGQVRAHAVEGVCAQSFVALDGRKLLRSGRTLYRWVAAFEQGGIRALEPAPRRRTEASLVLPEELLEFLRDQKELDGGVSIPEVIRRAIELGITASDSPPSRVTVWRACRRMELPTRRGRKRRAKDRDSRRFAYPHRMMMVLCDGKHFRVGPGRLKRVALFFLDDATRTALHVVVGSSESAELFLRGLYEMVRKFGLFGILYLDHGSGFIALDTIEVVRRLDALLIWGESRYPEGHGKVEKFNQTSLHQVLRGWDGQAAIDPSFGALELRLTHWLERYNNTPHEALDNDTPAQRFAADRAKLRFPESEEALTCCFVLQEPRKVSKDHVLSYGGTHYEVPQGLAAREVTVHRGVLDGRLCVLHRGRLVELHPVDLAANATARRARPSAGPSSTQFPLPKSAADMAFERDFQPVVAPDGGYPDDLEVSDEFR
jgi:putative transposase